MAKGIEQARCCAICINSATPEGWFRQELELALSLQTTKDDFGVIPVLLPDAKPEVIPAFLSLRTWCDFRTGKDQDYAFHVLSQGIRGNPVGPWPTPDPTVPEVSLSVHERQILELQKFRTLGVHEEVVIEFERKILTNWFETGR
jgi:TIR domain